MEMLPKLGIGMGFRETLRSQIFLHRDKIDFLEITSDHYLDATPRKLEELELLRQHFPLIPHSLDLSLGSAEGIDEAYLEKLADLIERIQPAWFSDHICFTRSNGIKIGHLAPVPYTKEALCVFISNVERVKKRISAPLILENITYNLSFPSSEMSEVEFISTLLRETDCGMLLDATNLYINSKNLEYDWRSFLDQLPLERIVQVHFVGSHRNGDRLIDAHADKTEDEIWDVVREIRARCDIKGAILERDENFPEFAELLDEIEIAREELRKASSSSKAR
ncbi:MAG TPA: DUF692 domain-containing protein [Pyrinomonadaceae bacterium]|nr:DUF692 domain-containing protein [Pyrinomonadaceae bacterium]